MLMPQIQQIVICLFYLFFFLFGTFCPISKDQKSIDKANCLNWGMKPVKFTQVSKPSGRLFLYVMCLDFRLLWIFWTNIFHIYLSEHIIIFRINSILMYYMEMYKNATYNYLNIPKRQGYKILFLCIYKNFHFESCLSLFLNWYIYIIFKYFCFPS